MKAPRLALATLALGLTTCPTETADLSIAVNRQRIAAELCEADESNCTGEAEAEDGGFAGWLKERELEPSRDEVGTGIEGADFPIGDRLVKPIKPHAINPEQPNYSGHDGVLDLMK